MQAQETALTEVAPGVTRMSAIDALRRVLASAAFAESPRSREFLAYVVRETIDGRGDRLKERTIARNALERSDAFDPRLDAAVRVQASRVRAALDRYYADEGSHDTVRLTLPKGSYVPVISAADDAAEPSLTATLGPGVAVVRFWRPDDAPELSALSTGLTESLVNSLSAFSGIRVIGPLDEDGQGASPRDERRLGSRLDVHYLVHGAVALSEGGVSVTVRLVDADSGGVVWAASFEGEASSLTGFTGHEDIVRHVAGVVGDYSGEVLRRASRSGGGTADPIVWAAMLAFYDGLERTSPEAAAVLRAGLLEAQAREPENPLLLSMLASTESYLAMASEGDQRTAYADACEAHARAALVLDPTSGHAHLTLGAAAFSRGNVPMCLEHLRLAVDLSPGNPSILYGAGWVFGKAGQWDRGVELVRESIRLNPTSPSVRYLFLAVDALVAGDFAGSLADAMRYPHVDQVWTRVILALALDGLGHRAEALDELRQAAALVPDVRAAIVDSRDFPPAVLEYVTPRLDDLLGSLPNSA